MKFSIFLPTYNRINLLKHTIESLRNQSYRNFEVYVYDRGSEPSAMQMIDALSDNRFIYVSSSQKTHICDDAEAMLSTMKGEVFLFLADDDVLVPKALHILCELFKQHQDIEFISSGYASYHFLDKKTLEDRRYTGLLMFYSARSACYHFLCSWGIGARRKYLELPQAHCSLTFIKASLVVRTRLKQQELFLKSFGDIGYVGALANTERFLHVNIPLGVIGAGHQRETDGIVDRFKHEKEMKYIEHVKNRSVCCFENIGLDTHLKVIYRNRLEQEYPPFVRPQAYRRQLKRILKDSPKTVKTWRDAIITVGCFLDSLLGYFPKILFQYKTPFNSSKCLSGFDEIVLKRQQYSTILDVATDINSSISEKGQVV